MSNTDFQEMIAVKANFFCPKCKGELFRVLKGYYAKNPLLICSDCNLILTFKELKQAKKEAKKKN